MKRNLLKLLVCPACGESLDCQVWSEASTKILEGLLVCNRCEGKYPIIAGVPRMLLDPLRGMLWEYYKDFFVRNSELLPAELRGNGEHQEGRRTPELSTQQSFGYEWTRFSSMLPEWEKNYWGYMAPSTAKSLKGKAVLDAGCGMGRHLYFTAQHSDFAVGVDFSAGVDSAYRNVRELSNAHVVQADLNNLPFRPETFDLIYSFGVVHHLPKPEQTLEKLLTHLRQRGEFRVYVYWTMEGQPWWKKALLNCVTGLRKITSRLPHRLLLWACYPISVGAWAVFVLPYKCLTKFSLTHRWAESLPLKQYAQYPFRVLVNDQFDRFSAPLERRYGRSELEAWLRSAGLEGVAVEPYSGWLGYGTKTGARIGNQSAPGCLVDAVVD